MESEELRREVKGIWIPIEIWERKDLSVNEKVLLAEIDSYTTKDKDCFMSDEYISDFLGISITNANKTLSSLMKKGLIVKTRFDGRKRYIQTALSKTTDLPCQKRQTSNIYNLINLNREDNIYLPVESTREEKENNTNVLSKKNDFSLDLSIISDEMLSCVTTWLTYKKEKKQTYKPTGFVTFYKSLLKYSNNNPIIANAIIEKSMRNNYAGIFPLKEYEIQQILQEDNNNTTNTNIDEMSNNKNKIVINGQIFK